jgi:hypothetical protein
MEILKQKSCYYSNSGYFLYTIQHNLYLYNSNLLLVQSSPQTSIQLIKQKFSSFSMALKLMCARNLEPLNLGTLKI